MKVYSAAYQTNGHSVENLNLGTAKRPGKWLLSQVKYLTLNDTHDLFKRNFRLFRRKKSLLCKRLTFKQVMRGHNIAADGWAGTSNPQPHPQPPPTQ